MTIQITICTDGAAFADDTLMGETLLVLDRCWAKINESEIAIGDLHTLRDTNGNQCGTIEVRR